MTWPPIEHPTGKHMKLTKAQTKAMAEAVSYTHLTLPTT